jgi:hypothetical protein
MSTTKISKRLYLAVEGINSHVVAAIIFVASAPVIMAVLVAIRTPLHGARLAPEEAFLYALTLGDKCLRSWPDLHGVGLRHMTT